MSHFVLASITSSLTDFIGRNGVYAVLLIMAADAVLPVGGELTMLYAGAVAGGAIAGRHPEIFGHVVPYGLEAFLILAAAGTIGYLVGSLIGWAIGHYGGRPLIERHGRWLHLSPQNFERAERWFERRGSQAVLLGRLTPVVRSFISIPAGGVPEPGRSLHGADAHRLSYLVLRVRAGRLGSGQQLRQSPPRLHRPRSPARSRRSCGPHRVPATPLRAT